MFHVLRSLGHTSNTNWKHLAGYILFGFVLCAITTTMFGLEKEVEGKKVKKLNYSSSCLLHFYLYSTFKPYFTKNKV